MSDRGDMKGAAQRLARLPGAPLLLLRAFLGVTFTFAGLQKLSNPGFFDASTPGSIQQQLTGAALTTPVHFLVSLAQHAPVLFGVAIALAEVAVGLATLAGLLARPAAVGGMLLSLTFFLTISFTTSPYYYGSDIVFLFAWTPLALGGAGALALDDVLARRRAALTRSVPATSSGGDPAPGRLDRRAALGRGVLAGALGLLTLALGGLTSAIGRALAPKSSGSDNVRSLSNTVPTDSSSSTTSTEGGSSGTQRTGSSVAGTPAGTPIGLASVVPVGGAASFTDPAENLPAFAVQPTAGHFVAFSAICTHAGCTVAFDQATESFDCPCHGSRFDAFTGAVLQGPAASPLPSIPIDKGSDGKLYVDG